MLNTRSKGFTLIEIIIVLAVLAVLAAIVTPNVAGFLSRSKQEAWEADRNVLQASVDAWRADIRNRTGNPWPTRGGSTGSPPYTASLGAPTTSAYNGVINIATLATAGYLKGADAVKSANTTDIQGHGTSATNSPSGSYTWYINSSGVVHSLHKDTATTDFQTDVYP